MENETREILPPADTGEIAAAFQTPILEEGKPVFCLLLRKQQEGHWHWELNWRAARKGAFACVNAGKIPIENKDDVSLAVSDLNWEVINIEGIDIDQVKIRLIDNRVIEIAEPDILQAITIAQLLPYEASLGVEGTTVVTITSDPLYPEKKHVLVFPPRPEDKIGGQSHFLIFARQVIKELIKFDSEGGNRKGYLAAAYPPRRILRPITTLRNRPPRKSRVISQVDQTIDAADLETIQALARIMYKTSQEYPPIREFLQKRESPPIPAAPPIREPKPQPIETPPSPNKKKESPKITAQLINERLIDGKYQATIEIVATGERLVEKPLSVLGGTRPVEINYQSTPDPEDAIKIDLNLTTPCLSLEEGRRKSRQTMKELIKFQSTEDQNVVRVERLLGAASVEGPITVTLQPAQKGIISEKLDRPPLGIVQTDQSLAILGVPSFRAESLEAGSILINGTSWAQIKSMVADGSIKIINSHVDAKITTGNVCLTSSTFRIEGSHTGSITGDAASKVQEFKRSSLGTKDFS